MWIATPGVYFNWGQTLNGCFKNLTDRVSTDTRLHIGVINETVSRHSPVTGLEIKMNIKDNTPTSCGRLCVLNNIVLVRCVPENYTLSVQNKQNCHNESLTSNFTMILLLCCIISI